jgi:hypothetical protein
VDLDPVGAGLACAPRSLREPLHELLDLGNRHPLALETVDRLLLVGRAPALLELDPSEVPLSPRERELHDVLAVVLVDALDELAPERDRLVTVDVRVVRDDQAAWMHRCVRRDDRPDAAAGELQVPVDVDLRSGAVVVVEPAGEARPEHTILDRQVPKLQRLEDDARIHAAVRSGTGS